MTNFHSIAGGLIWTAIASLLMLAALTPVSLGGVVQAPVHMLADASVPADRAAA